jgi:hypothetical protein
MRSICAELERQSEVALGTTAELPSNAASLDYRQSENAVLGTNTLGIQSSDFQGYDLPPWNPPISSLDSLNKWNPSSAMQLDDWNKLLLNTGHSFPLHMGDDVFQHAMEGPDLEVPFLDMRDSSLG